MTIPTKPPKVLVGFRIDTDIRNRVLEIAEQSKTTEAEVYRFIVGAFFSDNRNQNGYDFVTKKEAQEQK